MESNFEFPNDVLLLIFENLSATELVKCSRVSKQWNEVAFAKHLWSERSRGKHTKHFAGFYSLFSDALMIKRGSS